MKLYSVLKMIMSLQIILEWNISSLFLAHGFQPWTNHLFSLNHSVLSSEWDDDASLFCKAQMKENELEASCCCYCCQVASVVSDSVRPHRWQRTRHPINCKTPHECKGGLEESIAPCPQANQALVRLPVPYWGLRVLLISHLFRNVYMDIYTYLGIYMYFS